MKEPSVFWTYLNFWEPRLYIRTRWGFWVQFLIPTQHGYDPLGLISANLSIGLFMLSWVDKLKCTNCIVKGSGFRVYSILSNRGSSSIPWISCPQASQNHPRYLPNAWL
jgi:hypothetical protein